MAEFSYVTDIDSVPLDLENKRINFIYVSALI